MKQLALSFLVACTLLACGPAQAQYSCSATASSVSGTYVSTSTLNQTGNVNVTCTRSNNTKTPTLLIGIGNGINSRQLKRQGGTDLLPYGIYRNSSNAGSWTTGTGQTSGSPAAGGLLAPWDFGASNSPPGQDFPYYFQVAAGYYVPPGTYDDNPVTVTVSFNGTPLTTASFVPQVTILPSCSLSAPPGTLTFNYTAFGSAVNSSTSFGVTCTLTTPYTLALDATSGAVSGIGYTLALSAPGGAGTGVAQTYSINGTAAAGQSGTCAVANCSASQARTLTISY